MEKGIILKVGNEKEKTFRQICSMSKAVVLGDDQVQWIAWCYFGDSREKAGDACPPSRLRWF